jgi:hypothetical protein
MATSWYRTVEEERMIHRALSLCLILAVVGLISGCADQGATSDEDGGSAENGEGELTPVDVSSPVHGSRATWPRWWRSSGTCG